MCIYCIKWKNWKIGKLSVCLFRKWVCSLHICLSAVGATIGELRTYAEKQQNHTDLDGKLRCWWWANWPTSALYMQIIVQRVYILEIGYINISGVDTETHRANTYFHVHSKVDGTSYVIVIDILFLKCMKMITDRWPIFLVVLGFHFLVLFGNAELGESSTNICLFSNCSTTIHRLPIEIHAFMYTIDLKDDIFPHCWILNSNIDE